MPRGRHTVEQLTRGVVGIPWTSGVGVSDDWSNQCSDESMRIESLNYCSIEVIYTFSHISFKENLHSQV